MKHLKAAAAAGDASAQFNLGVMYDRRLDDNNHPAASDRIEAVKWLSSAARQGLPRAQQRLGELLAENPDAPAEQVEAYAWFVRALANTVGAHHELSQKSLKKLSAVLTTAQVAEAEGMARSFEPNENHAIEAPIRRRAR